MLFNVNDIFFTYLLTLLTYLGRNSIPILLHFQKLLLGGAVETIWGKSSISDKVTGCKNYSEISHIFKSLVILYDKLCRHILKCACFVNQYIDCQKQSVGDALKVLAKYLKTRKIHESEYSNCLHKTIHRLSHLFQVSWALTLF